MLLVGAAAITVKVRTPTDELAIVDPGTLTVAEGAVGSWQVDGLRVELTADGLSISDADRTVWASDPGAAFVTAGRGSVSWTEHTGYFWPKVDHTDRLHDQQVESAGFDDGNLVVSGTLTGDRAEPAPYTIVIEGRRQTGVQFAVEVSSADTVGLVTGRTAGAGVHGFGEQFTDFDLSGRLLPIVVREQGVGRGLQPLTVLADVTERGAGGTDQMTYAAASTFLTDDLRGVRLDPADPTSQAFAVADTRTDDRVTLELWSSRLSAQFVAADSPTALVAAQQAGTSRPELAEWVGGGAILGLQGGSAEVRRKLQVLLDAGAEVSGVWLQDWTGRRTTDFGDRLWWTWQLDSERYPDWAELVADLHQRGIRTTTYVNPWLVDAAPKGDPAIRNLWAEARDRGYLVRTDTGEPYQVDQGGFDATLVDLTNPDARDWFAEVIATEVLADGVDGFMADFGEGLPFDAVLADGDAAQAHNAWPRLWAETVQQACRQADRPDCVAWFRAGSLGQPHTAPLFWTGDQLVDFGPQDGLASALLGAFSAGVSGWPLVHSDVGGYTSINAVIKQYERTPELLQRWAEYEAFGVVMRTHEGNRPDHNSQAYDPGSADGFARMTRIHAALEPYRSQVIAEATRTGVPALRHGWLVAPGTPAASVDTQIFLGDALLVAPVLHAGATSVTVTFPPGRWVHLLTGEEFAGDRTVEVSAPLGTPAAFLRADHPLRDQLQRDVAQAIA